jgi:hypothetical protein
MSNVKEVKPVPSKSGKSILDCLMNMLKLARQRDIRMVAIVMIGVDGKPHISLVGPKTEIDQDKLLAAIDRLHDQINYII